MTARAAALALFVCFLSWSTAAQGVDSDRSSLPFHLAGYGYHIEDLNGTGFDAIYYSTGWRQGVLEELAQKSRLADALGVKFIVGLYYCTYPGPGMQNYSRAVGRGRPPESVVPSPVDETWWRVYVEEPGIALANLSLHYPIWGVVWDTERYIEGRYFEFDDYSYDEAAVQAFARETNRTIPYVPPEERYSWLVEHGLAEEFERWEERTLYSMAKRTEQKIHAINPNLSLGLLGFEDGWFHWTILRAFNSSSAPVTAWCEETYWGYDRPHGPSPHFPPRIYRQLMDQYGINGVFLPGIWAKCGPWMLLTEMEKAIRDNGALWVYQWHMDTKDNPFEEYKKMYQVFRSFIFFNQSTGNPLPSFDLYPGVRAKPYVGPDGTVSVLLDPYTHVVPNIFMVSSDRDLWYVAENLSARRVGRRLVLGAGEVPCIVSGLREEDLVRLEALAMVEELGNLTAFYRGLGLAGLPGAEDAHSAALSEFAAARYSQVVSRISALRRGTYEEVLAAVWPKVEEALRDPRSSNVPIGVIRSISNARSMFDSGRDREGEAYLFEGLKEWYSVREPFTILLLAVVPLLLGRRWQSSTGSGPLESPAKPLSASLRDRP